MASNRLSDFTGGTGYDIAAAIDLLDEGPPEALAAADRFEVPDGARVVVFQPGTMPRESPLEDLSLRAYRPLHLAVVPAAADAADLAQCGTVTYDGSVDSSFAVSHRLVEALNRVAAVVALNQDPDLPNEIRPTGWPAASPYPTIADGKRIVAGPPGLATEPPLFGVLNMSLGPPSVLHPRSAGDPVQWATRYLSQACVVVAAAGNSGVILGQETMSAWAEPDWVLAVGATEDRDGSRRLSRSSVGDPAHPESGPDLLAWGASTLDETMKGTSFAAPRASHTAVLCIAAVLQLRQLYQVAVGEPEGVRLVGLSFVDRFRTGVADTSGIDPMSVLRPGTQPDPGRRWLPRPDRLAIDALPLVGPSDAAALLFEVAAAQRPKARLVGWPGPIRDLLRLAASRRPLEGLGCHEQGAGFLGPGSLEELLASMPARDLLGVLGWDDVAETLTASTAAEPLFSAEGLATLEEVVTAAAPIVMWDYPSGTFQQRQLSTLSLDPVGRERKASDGK